VKSRTKANTQVLETIDADAAFAVIVDAVSSCVKS